MARPWYRSILGTLGSLLIASSAGADPIRPALFRLFDPPTALELWTRYHAEPDAVLTILAARLAEGVPSHPPGFWRSVVEHLERWEEERAGSNPPPIPEPMTAAMLGLGLAGLSLASRWQSACPSCNGRKITPLRKSEGRVRAWCRRCGRLAVDRLEELEV